MISAVFKLLRLRLRLFLNTFRHGTRARKFGMFAGALGFLAFAMFMSFACWFVLRAVMRIDGMLVAQAPEISEMLNRLFLLVPVGINAGAFFIGILVNTGVLLQTLYMSGDLEFLLAAPIPGRAVFISKVMQAILPVTGLFLLFTGPVLIAFGLTQGYSPLYYLMFAPLIVALIVGGSGLSSLIVMGLVRIMSPRRATEILGLVGALFGMSFYVVSQGGRSAIFRRVGSEQLADIVDSAQVLVNAWNPLAWPGLALYYIGRSDWASGLVFSGLTLALMTVIFSLSLFAAERLYLSGWSRVQAGQRRPRRKKARPERRQASGILAWISPQVRAVTSKDFKLYRRDIRNLSQLIAPIVFVLVWIFFFFRNASNEIPSLPGVFEHILEMSNLGVIFYIVWAFVLRFGHGAFSMEGKQWWILKTAPVKSSSLVLSKFLVAYIPVLVIGFSMLTLLSVMRPPSLEVILYQFAVFPLIAAGATSLSLAFGILGANFTWENPAELYKGTTSCLGTLTSGIFLVLLAAMFLGLPIGASVLELHPLLGFGAAILAGSLVIALGGFLPLRVAMGQISSLGE